MIDRLLKYRCFRFFLNNEKAGALVGKCILLLLIPYGYLFLCGFLFDKLLKWYFMTTYIFIGLVLLYLVALVLIGMAVKNYKVQKGGKRRRVKSVEE